MLRHMVKKQIHVCSLQANTNVLHSTWIYYRNDCFLCIGMCRSSLLSNRSTYISVLSLNTLHFGSLPFYIVQYSLNGRNACNHQNNDLYLQNKIQNTNRSDKYTMTMTAYNVWHSFHSKGFLRVNLWFVVFCGRLKLNDNLA